MSTLNKQNPAQTKVWHESVHNGLVIQNFVGTAPVSDIVIVSQSPEIVSGGATSISDARQRQSPL